MDYGKVLQRAWEIVWKHKVLWLFGVLAGCGSGGGNVSNSFQWSGGGGGSGAPMPPWMRGMERWFNNLTDAQIMMLVAAAFLFMVFLMLFLTALRVVGVAGVIQGAALADEGQSFTLGELFAIIRPRLLPLFLLSLVISAAIFLVMLVFIAFWFGITLITFGIGFFCLLPLLCLIIPIAVVISIFIIQAEIALVLEGHGVRKSLQRGWQVVRDHVGEYIVMGLILVIAGFVLNLVLALPLTVALIPAMISAVHGDATGFWIAGLCLLVYLPVLIVLSGLVQSYLLSAWTLTYRELTRPSGAEGEIKDYVEPLAA